MKTAAAPAQDAQRLLALRRHRRFATGCLLVALILYVATQFVDEPGYWVRLLRAGAEAGLIGGIADWFAVTALFRRPLGLPIPHTAIIPRNKDRLGDGFGAFVERNFLAPELIAQKLREVDLAARLGEWLSEPRNSELVAQRLVALAPYLINSLDDRETRAFFRQAFSQQLRQVDLAPLLLRLLALATASRQHQQLFDRVLLLARDLLLRHEATIYEKVQEHSAWWVPRRIDRRLARAILEGVQDWLGDLAEHDHPVRQDFDRSVAELVDKLEGSASFRRRLDQLKEQLLASEELQRLLETAWDQLRAMLLQELTDPATSVTPSLAASLRTLGGTLQADGDARRRLNQRLELFLNEFVVPFRFRIGGFISEVVRGWDTRTVSQRLELEVGRDLQFIRINGTLVGALVGCILFVLTQLIFY